MEYNLNTLSNFGVLVNIVTQDMSILKKLLAYEGYECEKKRRHLQKNEKRVTLRIFENEVLKPAVNNFTN